MVWVVGPLCLTYDQGIGALQMRKTEKRFTTEYFEDGHALQKRASGVGLVWNDGHFFNRV